MKTKLLIAGLALGFSLAAGAATNDLAGALQRGLFEEEANHDLGAAVQAYQSAIAHFDRDRKLAATAVFRLGECYRKQGQTNQAVAQYERVLREFADQAQVAALSQQNLTSLGAPASVAAVPAVSVAAREEQKRLLADEIKLVVKKLDTRRQQYKTGIINESEVWAAEQEVLELKRQAAALEAGLPAFGTTAPGIPATEEQRRLLAEEIKLMEKKLAAEHQQQAVGNLSMGDVMTTEKEILELRRQAAALEAGLAAAGPPAAGQTTPPTSGEEEELRRIQAMFKDSPDLINSRTDGFTPLHSAAESGQLVVAEFLLTHGAEVGARTEKNRGNLLYGDTSLHGAARAGHKSMVELLLRYKAEVDAPGGGGMTPLHAAANHGFRGVVEVLLAHGANVNAVTHGGQTPLHLAFSSPAVEVLLAHHANVNAQDLKGWSPLHGLANAGDAGAARAMEAQIAAGANVDLRDHAGLTPLELAQNRPLTSAVRDVIACLRRHGARENFPDPERIRFATATDRPEVVFTKGSNAWSHFTLLETVAVRYCLFSADPQGGSAPDSRQRSYALPAHDFSRIRVRHPTPDFKGWQEQMVDLTPLLQAGDCSRDVALSWGDVVELPSLDPVPEERVSGFQEVELTNLAKCLTRHVALNLAGRTTNLAVEPDLGFQTPRSPAPRVGFPPPFRPPVSPFAGRPSCLRPVLQRSGLPLGPVDLSRVKVTRTDPVAGGKREWVFDCSDSEPAPDFWVRDGDVIEAPARR